MNKGILVVVSGFSGAGKGTVMKRLMEKYDGYALSVSATTRKPRPGEEDGREYFFRTRDEFEKLIEEDALLEYAQYVENYYGTPRSYVEEQLQAGRNVILEIEIQGAMKIKEKILLIEDERTIRGFMQAILTANGYDVLMAGTGANASASARVSLCEALFACVALAAGFLREREFYQQLDLFCNSPENARCLSSILDEPRTLEGSIAYPELAVRGKAASDALIVR